MDVGRPFAHGLLKDHVHELNDGAFVVACRAVEDVFNFFGFLFLAGGFCLVELSRHVGEVAPFVENPGDEVFDGVARGENGDGLTTGQPADEVEPVDVEGIDDGGEDVVVALLKRHDLLFHGDGVVVMVGETDVDGVEVERLPHLDAELETECAQDVDFLGASLFDEDFAESPPGLGLLQLQRVIELLGRDVTMIEENFTDGASTKHIRTSRG